MGHAFYLDDGLGVYVASLYRLFDDVLSHHVDYRGILYH